MFIASTVCGVTGRTRGWSCESAAVSADANAKSGVAAWLASADRSDERSELKMIGSRRGCVTVR